MVGNKLTCETFFEYLAGPVGDEMRGEFGIKSNGGGGGFSH